MTQRDQFSESSHSWLNMRIIWRVFKKTPKPGSYSQRSWFKNLSQWNLSISIFLSLKGGLRTTVLEKHTHQCLYRCVRIFTAILSVILKNWKQHKCPWMENWLINMLRYIHTVKCYTAIKKTKENRLLSEKKNRFRIKSLVYA